MWKTRKSSMEAIRSLWESWGLPIVTARAIYQPEDVEGLEMQDERGELLGLVTFVCADDTAEIVSLDALERGQGVGTELLIELERVLGERGIRQISLVTTNDNPRAISFYIRRGYRLVRLHLDAMDRVRALKPGIPQIGQYGIPLRDMLELKKALDEPEVFEPDSREE